MAALNDTFPPRLTLTRRTDGWWITGLLGGEDAGPYDTRREADEDRVGLLRSYRLNAKWWKRELSFSQT